MNAIWKSLVRFYCRHKNSLVLICGFASSLGLANMSSYPQKLSEWPIFAKKGAFLDLHESTFPYTLQNELFSDYAHKFRSIFLPPHTKIQSTTGLLVFPSGTIISKTFSYDRKDSPQRFTGSAAPLNGKQLIETRLLVNQNNTWKGLSYVWNEEQTEAFLKLGGARQRLTVTLKGERKEFWYHVPNFNQCQSCHTKQEGFRKTMQPIGPKLSALNIASPFRSDAMNQLDVWEKEGKIEGLSNRDTRPHEFSWNDRSQSLDVRARAYLNINCAHCHSATGSAKSSALWLDTSLASSIHTGICKSPVAAGNASYGGRFDIVPGDPEHSILYNRMKSLDPGTMMPELGRSLQHEEGLKLIHEWIQTLEGHCPEL